jgi:hypothetical protein
MFGTGKRLECLEREIRITLRQKDQQIESLERQLAEAQSWGKKWREKAKFFRRANKDLVEKAKETTP